MHLFTRLTSAACALALSFGLVATTAAPARASDDAAKLLFGAAALAIIAGAVHAESKHRSVPQTHYQPPQHVRPKPQRQHRPVVLPARCEIALRSSGHVRHGYRERCLRRAGLSHLPSQCVVGEWKGAVYGARCLGRHGYVRG
ncbi:MAG: hypothetical protein JXQ79_00170 [Rhodobacteraceae bacterium]|nr:hypothetical protein [Paracoccaceae bacterium]